MSAALTPAKLAFDAWWRAQSRMGDPSRRPHLVSEAFGAGYHAALEAHPERDARRLPAAATVTLGPKEPLEGMLMLDLPCPALVGNGGEATR